MARARGRDSHVGGGTLDRSIRGPLAPSISPGFYGWTGRGGSSGMVPEPRPWVQFPLATHFFPLRNNSHLPCCLLSTHLVRACGRDSHAEGGMLDYSIRGSLTLSISLGFYGWTGRAGTSSIEPSPFGLYFCEISFLLAAWWSGLEAKSSFFNFDFIIYL
jgi:hypothetical protein